MKEKIPAIAVIAAIVIVVAGALFFGWHAVAGGGSTDMTQENINRYQKLKEQTLAHKPTSPQDAAKAGAPINIPGAPGKSAPVTGSN
jgi:hypothetical protein